MEWTWQIADFMVARLRDENTRTDNWSAGTAATHTGWEQSLWEQTYMIVEASHSSTLTLCSLESQLNNLDLLSKDVQESVVWCHWVRGQGCDAYTARLPAVILQKPDFIGLVPMQNCRETRSGLSTWLLERWLSKKIRWQKSNCFIDINTLIA